MPTRAVESRASTMMRGLITLIVFAGCTRGAESDDGQPGFEALTNGAFEDAPGDEWRFCGMPPVAPMIYAGCGREGSHGVRFELAPDNQWECFSQKIFPRESQRVVARAWVKRTDAGGRAWLAIECVDPDLTSEEDDYGVVAGASAECETLGEWTALETAVDLPRGTEYVRIFGTANGPAGQVSFDDFELELH